MTWDRFDDAHDDVLADIRAIKGEIRELQEKLTAAGAAYPPFERPPHSEGTKDRHGGGPHGWYLDTLDEESALAAYRDHLKRLSEVGG